jgi:hypothetical protein
MKLSASSCSLNSRRNSIQELSDFKNNFNRALISNYSPSSFNIINAFGNHQSDNSFYLLTLNTKKQNMLKTTRRIKKSKKEVHFKSSTPSIPVKLNTKKYGSIFANTKTDLAKNQPCLELYDSDESSEFFLTDTQKTVYNSYTSIFDLRRIDTEACSTRLTQKSECLYDNNIALLPDQFDAKSTINNDESKTDSGLSSVDSCKLFQAEIKDIINNIIRRKNINESSQKKGNDDQCNNIFLDFFLEKLEKSAFIR